MTYLSDKIIARAQKEMIQKSKRARKDTEHNVTYKPIQESDWYNYVCHGYAKGTFPRETKAILTITKEKKNFKTHSRRSVVMFYDWLLNKSPWSSVFLVKDPEFAYDTGTIIRTDVPASLLLSAAIFSRTPWDGGLSKEANVAMFKLIDDGADIISAYILVGCLHGNYVLGRTFCGSDHRILAANADTHHFQGLLRGELCKSNLALWKDGGGFSNSSNSSSVFHLFGKKPPRQRKITQSFECEVLEHLPYGKTISYQKLLKLTNELRGRAEYIQVSEDI